MQRTLTFSFISALLILLAGFRAQTTEAPLSDGDIIFIVNPAGQGKAIQLATKSEFTHVGIIFIENGKPVVYHAVEPVSKNTLAEFKSMSVHGSYKIKRLKNKALLTPQVVSSMLADAKSAIGKHYDVAFSWNDEELYCSEFVWKLYDHALQIHVGEPRPLKEFDLSHPTVRSTLQTRYGENIPYDENMISPGDMFRSSLLN